MQNSVRNVFHYGKPVRRENIRPDWTLHVTRAPNGQWFTLNNRLLLAYNMGNWPDDGSMCKYLADILLPNERVKIVPFHEAEADFRRKFTSKDNGNTCKMRNVTGSHSEDWVCAKYVNGSDYKKYLEGRSDPFFDPWLQRREGAMHLVLLSFASFLVLLLIFVTLQGGR